MRLNIITCRRKSNDTFDTRQSCADIGDRLQPIHKAEIAFDSLQKQFNMMRSECIAFELLCGSLDASRESKGLLGRRLGNFADKASDLFRGVASAMAALEAPKRLSSIRIPTDVQKSITAFENALGYITLVLKKNDVKSNALSVGVRSANSYFTDFCNLLNYEKRDRAMNVLDKVFKVLNGMASDATKHKWSVAEKRKSFDSALREAIAALDALARDMDEFNRSNE